MYLAAFRSPVCSFAEHIIGSVASIAPERADELKMRSKGVSFCFTTTPGYDFASVASERRVYVPIRGVEYLWVLAFTTWVLYRHYSAEPEAPPQLVFDRHSDTRDIPKLLRWSAANQQSSDYLPWPPGLPAPEPLEAASAAIPQ
jgi:hypothetical protein